MTGPLRARAGGAGSGRRAWRLPARGPAGNGGLPSWLRRAAALLALAGMSVTSGGCAYKAGYYRRAEIKKPFRSAPAEPQFVRGRKNLVIDKLGHYVFSLPSKIILWNWSVDNHDISEENEEIFRQYMDANSLDTTLVRLNTYAPHKEFARLRKNKDVNGGYKYTLGVITVLFYTLIPDRLFAGLVSGDHYNPYTNTINVYSNHPAILVHEAGHAKDFAQRSKRGSYAFARLVPGIDLLQEYEASTDAIDYFYCRQDKTNELNAYPILMPAYATYAGGYLGPFGFAGGVIYAHIYSRYYRHERREEMAHESPTLVRGTCYKEEPAAVGAAAPPG